MRSEDVFKDRAERTVKLDLSAEGRPYSRKDILEALLAAEVPRDAVEAIGMRERNVDWEVTKKTTPARDRLLQKKELHVKGMQCIIGGIRKSSKKLRVFYLPYYVPITVITEQLKKFKIAVLKTFQDRDRDRDTGLMSNVWNVIIEADAPDCVPDQLRWSFDGMAGRVLVNMVGREPKCLRCSQRGHKKFECKAPYCVKCRTVGHMATDACRLSYAARVSLSVAEAEEEMEDVVYDDAAEEGDNGQQTTNTATSWADQMNQLDLVASDQQTDNAGDTDVKQADETTSAEEPTAADTSASTETADRPVAVTTAMDADTSTIKKKEEGDWIEVKSQGEDRKRRGTHSPAERNGKVMAASSSKTASPREPAAGRRRTLPAPVVSGRHKH